MNTETNCVLLVYTLEQITTVPRALTSVNFHKKDENKRKSSSKFLTYRIDKLKQRLLYHLRRVLADTI